MPDWCADNDHRFEASDVERNPGFKRQGVKELVATLSQRAVSRNTFERDMDLN
jgi:hypothetical protein